MSAQWGSREVDVGFVVQGAPDVLWVHHGRGEVKLSSSASSLACCVEKQCLLVSLPLSPTVTKGIHERMPDCTILGLN